MPAPLATKDQSIPPSIKLQYEATRTIDNEAFLLSSSFSRLDHTAINAAFASPELYWARPISAQHMASLLQNSFCLGLYVLDSSDTGITTDTEASPEQHKSGQQIGLARLITDHVTFAWLTDVYVLPAYQRRGLGRWMISALNVILGDMPELRRAMLISSVGKTSAEYERIMGCDTWENGTSICMQRRGPAGAKLGTKNDVEDE